MPRSVGERTAGPGGPAAGPAEAGSDAGWEGHTGEINVGLLTAVLGADPRGLGGLDYFLCGPPALIEDAMAALDALGVPDHRIHTEQFDFA